MYDTTIVRENQEQFQISAGFAGQTLKTFINTRISNGKRGLVREGSRMCMPSCMSC